MAEADHADMIWSGELEYRLQQDLHAVEVIQALINDAYRGGQGAGRWTTEQHLVAGDRITLQALQDLIEGNDSELIVGFDGERPRCCIALKRLTEAVEFGTYAVAPELQGQGCGKALLRYAEEYAAGMCQRFQVCVVSQNIALIEFYQRRGYHTSGKTLPYPVGLEVGTPKIADISLTLLVKEL